ncbi:MAG: 2-C-methyl-D-erythritol 2,4-cyclodiphosphate synthase [Acholeplasmataceae bacterium]|nr:2-C-methyl-D-erythritol 2,4-cyclodiphosphate synthase [Acholeplasmataceae bacterium]
MNSAIIVAGGKSERFTDGNTQKINLLINNKPVYQHSVDVFLELGYEVILVINEEVNIKNVKVVKGGSTRSKSVYNGLKHANGEYVFIHDAARPLITKELIELLENNIKENDGVYLAKQVSDSLKVLTSDGYKSVDRDLYITSETPQVFRRDLLVKVFNKSTKDYTDEVGMVTSLFKDLLIVPVFHTASNDKITYYEDFLRVKKLFINNYRIGHSFDLHKLVKNRKLILGGVEIDYHLGLLGHSDADVLLHAITESIIGALGLGDLGVNFPDNDSKFKDISSKLLLENVLQKMKSKNYGISNIDIMLYLEEPKLKKHREEIINNIKDLLEIDLDKINFKVTTTEKVGPIGRNEAIAAEAVVLLEGV